MLLTLSTDHKPATDLGYLLHKNPARAQRFDLSCGVAHVFYPTADDDTCTCVLMVEVDPVALVRKRDARAFALDQYVNDRPYAASSLLSVAISQVFGTALSGICKTKPELVTQKLPLRATIASVPSPWGDVVQQLFEPLGYKVQVEPIPLDEKFPAFGPPRYAHVTLAAQTTLHDLLTHLYVLLPVLDGEKHYWIGEDEVQKLLRHAEGWLASHPKKEWIVDRYLQRRRHLTRAALAQLIGEAETEAEDAAQATETKTEQPMRLNDQRHDAVVRRLLACGAASVLDLGCNTGKLLERLLKERQFTRIVGYDVSHRALDVAADRLRFERMPAAKRSRIDLLHGSLVYRDARLEGFDAAAVVEVIEHLDAPRLASFERSLFAFARPQTVVLTTPNIEYNVRFEGMQPGALRHRDHRFEWTRAEFQTWAQRIAAQFAYEVEFEPVGPVDEAVGSPTQMGVFTCKS